MKGRLLSLFLILTLLSSLLVSCKESETCEFTHCEMTLVLDGSFEEEESDDFDLLISNGDAVVSLIRISFEAGFSQGIIDSHTPKSFAAFFMTESGKSEELFTHGDVPYYTYTENGVFYTVTFYRSHYAYFVITYATTEENKDAFFEKFLLFAENAYFNDAPDINTK